MDGRLRRNARQPEIAAHARLVQTVVAEVQTRVDAWNSPAGGSRTGGDWCDIVALPEGVFGLTIGDVVGHGEPASEMMEFTRAAIVGALRESRIPSQIVEMANALVYGRQDGVIVTAIVAILDRRRRTFTFANAGHPPPLLTLGAGDALFSHAASDLPLGIFPLQRCADFVIALPADALITLYTDGVTEHHRDPLAGERELAVAARSVYEHPSEVDLARRIAEHVFRNGRGDDDAAILTVRTGRVGAGSRAPLHAGSADSSCALRVDGTVSSKSAARRCAHS